MMLVTWVRYRAPRIPRTRRGIVVTWVRDWAPDVTWVRDRAPRIPRTRRVIVRLMIKSLKMVLVMRRPNIRKI